MKKLTDRHSVLVNKYFENGFNQAEAMRQTGYKSAPDSYQERLFKKEDVVREIERRKKKLAEKHSLTADLIIKEYLDIVNARKVLSKFIRITEDGKLDWNFIDASQEELAMIAGFASDVYMEGRGEGARAVKKFKLETMDSKGALDSLARIAGLFVDKKEISGPDGGPVEIKLDDPELARRLAFVLESGARNTDKETN